MPNLLAALTHRLARAGHPNDRYHARIRRVIAARLARHERRHLHARALSRRARRAMASHPAAVPTRHLRAVDPLPDPHDSDFFTDQEGGGVA